MLFDPADGIVQHKSWKRSKARFWKHDLLVALKSVLQLGDLTLAKDIAVQNEGEYCFGATFMFVHLFSVGFSLTA